MESIKDLFDKFKKPGNPSDPAKKTADNQAALAEMTLKAIHDGVVMTDKAGTVRYINPAAVTMTEVGSADHAVGLDYGLIIKLESKDGNPLSESENPLINAMKTNQPLERAELVLVSTKSNKRIPISISMLPAEGLSQNRIITFRNITAELEQQGETTEFISTASHEMRTPVATIDGYLSLALNPQTATLDDRARGYLTAAQKASKHLGKLFQDLLDVTKLDDGKIKAHPEPVEMNSFVQSIFNDYVARAKQAKIAFSFGSADTGGFDPARRLEQVVYSSVDTSFMREIMDNLIENALKYTPSGGSVYVNVRGDGDNVLINVTDTGIGISADDLTHIFQKFYRADNSDTREVGGTGLGLYLVKQRVEAMGGRVWAESGFGEGSTFFVSLPRISQSEYEKRMIAVNNQKLQPNPTVATASIAPAAPVVPPQAPITPTPPIKATLNNPKPAVLTQATKPSVPEPSPVIPQTPVQLSSIQQPQSTPQPSAQPVPAQQPSAQPAPVQQPQSISQPSAQPTSVQQPQSISQPSAQPAPAQAVLSVQPTTPTMAPAIASASPPPVTPTQLSSLLNNINLNGEAK